MVMQLVNSRDNLATRLVTKSVRNGVVGVHQATPAIPFPATCRPDAKPLAEPDARSYRSGPRAGRLALRLWPGTRHRGPAVLGLKPTAS